MSKKILGGLLILSALAFVFLGCGDDTPVQLPSAVQVPPVQVPGQVPPGMVPTVPGQVPPGTVPTVPGQPVATAPTVPQPAATEPEKAPPPQTELYPIEEEEPEKKVSGGGTGVCKLRGPETKGEELLGNYQCAIDTKDFPFGLKPPPFGCRVATSGSGAVKLMPQGQRGGMAISETKLSGFKLDGKYNFSGQKLQINTCMRAKGPGKYKGSGNGILNGDKKNRVKYTLTMTRQ